MSDRLPAWMKGFDPYEPKGRGGTFAARTLRALAGAIGRLRFQQGREGRRPLPALFKLVLLLAGLLVLSLARKLLVPLFFTALVLVLICFLPGRDLLSVLVTGLFAAALSLVLMLPAMILAPETAFNCLFLVWKVFLSVLMVSLFNHTTQWNHITGALKRLHVPGILIFTLDLTLKYIVLLGRLVSDLLTAYLLRAVGKDRQAYSSLGGVLGVTFLRGTEVSRETYEAMVCRGFTDDYGGL